VRYKAKIKDCYLIVKAKASMGEEFDMAALDAFGRIYLRGFLKPMVVKRNMVEYSGPVGVSLSERLKRPMSKRDFLFMIEQIIVTVQKIHSNGLALNKLVMDPRYVFINDVTKEMQFLYVPTTKDVIIPGVMAFIESIVYSVIPAPEQDTEYVSRFIYFMKSQYGFQPELIEKYIAKEDRSVVNAIKKQTAGQSGFMTSKQKHYYEHYDSKEENTESSGLREETSGSFGAPKADAYDPNGMYAPNGMYIPNSAPGAGMYAPNGAPVASTYSPNNAPGAGMYAPNGAPAAGAYSPNSVPGAGMYAPNGAPAASPYPPNGAPGAGMYNYPNGAPGAGMYNYPGGAPGADAYAPNGAPAAGMYDANGMYAPGNAAGAGMYGYPGADAYNANSMPQTGLYVASGDDMEEATGILQEDQEEATGILQDYEDEATGLLGDYEDEATGLLGEDDDEGTALLEEPQPVRYPTLFRVLTEESISVNKPVFRLGKERSYVDYFVTNNNAVSRSHADIVTRGDRYFVIDLNSKNHTYINDQMVAVQCETEIRSGDRLKLGNEEFIFNV